MKAQGLIGERTTARVAKLVATSRLLPEPGRAVIKGDSSTGKSFASQCALATEPPEGLYVRTGTSAKAMFYSEEDLRHRCIVFFEANQLGDDDDDLARVLRTLISEGRLVYEHTVPEKRRTEVLEKEGPVAFISTTCKASLDDEIETRILSLVSDNSDQQTIAVVRSLLEAAASPRPEPDLAEWHELGRWLASGTREVVMPWALGLAGFRLSGPPRLRRDITNLISLAQAHTLLHRGTRTVDALGRIISTLDDYEAVRDLLSDALAVATDKAVRAGTREIVDAVGKLRDEGNPRVSLSAVAGTAGKSKSTTHFDVHDALERGYLVNQSRTPNRFDLVIGDPLPAKEDLLPSRAELEEAFGERSASVRSGGERRKPSSHAGLRDSVRSVPSNWQGRGQEPAEVEKRQMAKLRQLAVPRHDDEKAGW